MAFASVGSIGSNSAKALGTTLSITLGAAVPAGDLIVVWVCWDTGSTIWPVPTDSKGNLYTMGGWVAHGSVNATSLYYCRVQTALASGDTITMTGSNLTAKAMSAERFTCDASKRIARNQESATLTTLAADPGAISVGSMTSQEYLMLHALGAEAPSTDAYTWDADYTQIAAAGTTGGAADTNITILGGYRIATLTGDNVDVTSDTANRDYNQILIALCEVPAYTGFPHTPILDDFNRANEAILDGGIWVASGCTGGPGGNFLSLTSLRAVSTSGNRGSWILNAALTANEEAYVTMATAPAASGQAVEVQIDGTGCGNDSTRGVISAIYRFAASGTVPSWPGFGLTNGSLTHCWVSRTPVNGDKVGIEQRGAVSYGWLDRGSGWECVCAAYLNGVSAGRKLGLSMYGGSAPKALNFGGGDIPSNLHLLPILGVGA